MKFFISLFLVMNLWAQNNNQLLSIEMVKKEFKKNNIHDPLLLANADKISSKKTLEALIKMYKSQVNFETEAYNLVINHGGFWQFNDESRQLLIYILDRPEPEIWFGSESVGPFNFVENKYQRLLSMHFIESYEKTALELRYTGDMAEYPSYLIGKGTQSLKVGLNSEPALDFIKLEFPRLPLNKEEVDVFFRKAALVRKNLILSQVKNQYHMKLLRNAFKYFSLLEDIEKESGSTLENFVNLFDRLHDENSFKVFNDVLYQYIGTNEFNKEKLLELPVSCANYIGE